MNLDYTLSSLKNITNGRLEGNPQIEIRSIFIDSRNYFNPENSLFIAIKGLYNDGHDYLQELYDKGLRNFIVSESHHKTPALEEANFLVVNDTLEALQLVAKHHRGKFNIPVIAITGSNGKTIVKEWLYHFLREHYNIVRSPKSYNSQVGVPLSLLQIDSEHSLAIFEAGISEVGEMEKLEAMIRPTVGILTNLRDAHIDNFKGKDELKSEKYKLFQNCDYVSFEEDRLKVQFEFVSEARAKLTTELTCKYRDEQFQYSIPFVDEASVKNSLTCFAFLLEFGIGLDEIIEKSKTLFPIAFRLESRKGKNNSIIIDDFYNSDIRSLEIALDYLERTDGTKKRHVVLSDIKSDSINVKDLYARVAGIINTRELASFIGVGPQLLRHRHLFNDGYFYENTEQYVSDVEEFHDAVILLKGSHEFKFEKISEILEERSHQTVLKINLRSLSDNIKKYKALLSPNTKMLAMVKAFGYGAGARELAFALQHGNVDYLGVAYTDEGVSLKKEGINLPILVMNPEGESYHDLIKNKLEPSIYSFNQLDAFIKKLIGLGIKDYPIHIKLDTGMNRLGFYPKDADSIVAAIKSQPEVRVKSVFTHLAASDDPKHDDFTLAQLKMFEQCASNMENKLGYQLIKHALNSTGIERFRENQMDMVRLGLGMYGVSGINNIETVGSLVTTVTQVKMVTKGGSVGYGRSEFVDNDKEIAIIPIGYADGFSWSMSNGRGHVFIKETLAPVVGRVCMDMTMIDVTRLNVKEGDSVEIFGKNRSIVDLAKEMNTIPYEVMTSISHRVVRIYVEE